MRALRIIRDILDHPLNQNSKWPALLRFFWWQFRSAALRRPIKVAFVEDSVLIVEKGMAGATGNIYNGLHEYREMLFTLHFLRPGDAFVDVGANVGTYTILAAKNAGADCMAFEPVPKTYQSLTRNIIANGVENLAKTFNNGVAGSTKTLFFSSGLDAANHAIAEDESRNGVQGIEVACIKLDDVVRNQKPTLMKIDVEGFETEVIQGAQETLKHTSLRAIIIELNGSGARYGFSEEPIHHVLTENGFAPFVYDPFSRELSALDHWGTHNTIYIRDLDFVTNRIKSARMFKVNNYIL